MKTIFRTIPIDSLRDHLSGQFQLIESTRHQFVQAIQIIGQYLKSIDTTIPINRETPKSFVRTIPIVRKYQTSIVQMTPINRQSPKTIVRTNPINSLRNHLSNQFQLLDSLWHHLPGQFQLIDNFVALL